MLQGGEGDAESRRVIQKGERDTERRGLYREERVIQKGEE